MFSVSTSTKLKPVGSIDSLLIDLSLLLSELFDLLPTSSNMVKIGAYFYSSTKSQMKNSIVDHSDDVAIFEVVSGDVFAP